MSNSHSHFSKVEVKELVKQASGKYRGVDWSVKVYSTANGRYIGFVRAGSMEFETHEFETVLDAFAAGAACVSEYFEMYSEVGNAS